MRDLDWDDLRFFLAVAAAGSLSAAARELNVNTTTVLRRIGNLEEALEARLFERLRSGYTLTQDGTRLLQSLEPVDTSLSSLQRDFQADSGAYGGIVRLSASDVVAGGLIGPAVPEFLKSAPDIALDIITDPSLSGPGGAPRVMNVLRDVDIALRLARPTQGDMLARKLCDVAYGVYATPAYTRKFGPIDSSGDLSGHQVVAFSEEERPLGPVWWLSRAEKNAKVVMRSSSVATRMTAVLGGEALAALPCFIARPQADLQPLIGPDIVGNLELWLLTRSDLARLGHVRAVMDFLIQHVAAQAAHLAGRDAG
ncbi:MAG: LysR family transcriptional regulator [Rhodobiaceae bacterium]|jgi:DNA-binding transcriptional LysR family regulator|nr:LysR family transcriptional regulator [Rhodobiaceae bacterium]MBT5518154.1 LysR family transcriptional regulator [Rhodobiaceae bacterium]